MRKELLRISHVDLERDGEQLLDDLEFQMFAGEIVGLVARNRKGQKEMVDLICRNDPISLGSVWYDGNVVNSYAYSSGESNKVALIEPRRAISCRDSALWTTFLSCGKVSGNILSMSR